MHKRSEGALSKGSGEHCWGGSIRGGTWNITTCCCGGVGEYFCIQECYYDQSKTMRWMTLQEEQNEVVARAML